MSNKYPPWGENPNCTCTNPMQAFFCMTGHLTECHYPYTCQQAECSHYLAELEAEDYELQSDED